METLIRTLSFLTLKPLLLFLILECYLCLLDFSIDFLMYTVSNVCILLTVFQRFDELAFSLCRRAFCSFQKQCCSYINKKTTYRCCHQRVPPNTCKEFLDRKILEKYLLKNSVLINMQLFSILLYFHRKSKNNIFFYRHLSSFL